MKIAFLALHWDCRQESGVLKKIRSQIQTWIALGHQARLFLLSYYPELWAGLGHLPVQHVCAQSSVGRIPGVHALVKQLLAWKPEVAYLRLNAYHPSLEWLMSAAPTVLEMNTNYQGQYRSHKSWIKYAYFSLTRDRIPKKSRGMVFAAREIASGYEGYGKPTLVLGNGIDLACHPQLPAPENPTPRLAFLGSPGAPWHGVDKILWLAQNFGEWHFDLIGPGPTSVDLPLPANVAVHGMLVQAEYLPILERADVAIGSLALHRNEMNEASPLKVREYLAYGLPTIIGYQDTDFQQPVPFLLSIPNTPDNVVTHAQAIDQFVGQWRGRRVPRDKIAHLDLANKERERVRFFAQALGAVGREKRFGKRP